MEAWVGSRRKERREEEEEGKRKGESLAFNPDSATGCTRGCEGK
jgi:hypothetical protein